MIKIELFDPKHMERIEKADVDSEILQFIGDITSRAKIYAESGPAITIFNHDRILALGGVLQFWKGVGEAWMMVSPEGRNKGMALFKIMDRFLNDCFENKLFHRVQASIVINHPSAHKSIMRLGFIPEGMMIGYGPNQEDYMRYVRF